ncbi:hypothetical protein [Bradyrhizobium retamae]|nr:hypothetical protein [Bradyrhizobium retamae]
MKPSQFSRGEDDRRAPQTRINSANFYKWRARYGWLDVSDAVDI